MSRYFFESALKPSKLCLSTLSLFNRINIELYSLAIKLSTLFTITKDSF